MTPPRGAAETGIKVVRHEQRQRFEAWDGDRVAGDTEYILAHDMVVFTHTEVDPSYEGQGVGSELAHTLRRGLR